MRWKGLGVGHPWEWSLGKSLPGSRSFCGQGSCEADAGLARPLPGTCRAGGTCGSCLRTLLPWFWVVPASRPDTPALATRHYKAFWWNYLACNPEQLARPRNYAGNYLDPTPSRVTFLVTILELAHFLAAWLELFWNFLAAAAAGLANLSSPPGAHLELFWNYFGTILELFRNYFGTI